MVDGMVGKGNGDIVKKCVELIDKVEEWVK